jgi:hypothetical protein
MSIRTIYTAVTECKRTSPRGSFLEMDVVLGLVGSENDRCDIKVECTFADFRRGRKYLVTIHELEEAQTML